jgi:uroporphyrinogen-III synthase
VDFRNKGADAIIFTSSSTALSYIEQEEDLTFEKTAQKPVFFSFGPETSKTLKENNLSVAAESDQPSMDSMIKALISRFSK